MRKFLVPLALLLLVAGFFGWRKLHPKLTDAQQISANLDAICEYAGERNPRNIAYYLAKNFQAGGVDKKDFQNSLAGGMLQYRKVDLKLSSVKTNLKGDTAQSTGRFLLTLRSELDSPPQVQGADFQLKWQKIDGEWKIVRADVPNLGQLGE